MTPRFQRACRAGNSLLEVAVATLLVAILLVAALQAAGQSLFSQIKTADRIRGQRLAQSLLAEVTQLAYSEPGASNPPLGADASETGRATFDDVDDYHGYSESPPQNSAGAALTEYAGWTRSVAVERIDPVTLAITASESGAKRITISARRGAITIATAEGIRTSAP
jgi:Tfp pilus assembly protein PilV